MLIESAVIAVSLALLIGLSLGLLGGGGSILTVPALVYALGFEVKPAVAMSLFIVGLTSLIGAAAHWRLGNVRLSSAALFSGLAGGGAFAGARLSSVLPGNAQLALLAVVMLVGSVSMFRRPSPQAREHGPRSAPASTVLALAAVGVGMLTGLLGVGGGFLVVPALTGLTGIPMRQAVGTSLAVIALNSAAGFVGYLGVVPVPWAFLAGFTTVATIGALGGAAMIRLVPVAALRRSFAVLLLAGGGLLLSKNLVALGAGDQSTPPRDPPAVPTR